MLCTHALRPRPCAPLTLHLLLNTLLSFVNNLSICEYICILYIYMYLYDMLLFMMIYYGNTCLAENRMQCAKKKNKRKEIENK